MFTTGVHLFLNTAAGCYLVAFLIRFTRAKSISLILFGAGFIVQSLYLIGRGWLGGVFIPNAIFEGPFFLPWCLALIGIFGMFHHEKDQISAEILLVFAFSLMSVFYAKGIIPPTPKKITIWAQFFFISESLAHACFYVVGALSFLALLKKNKQNGTASLMVWGIIFYTVAQVTGAVWCFLGWGNTFSWGARHLSSAAIWTFFAGLLHLKYIPVWRNRVAFLEVFGAVFVFVISYGHYLHEMTFSRIGG